MPKVDQLTGSEVRGWKLTSILGNGADGVVYLGEREGQLAAIKIFFPENLDKDAWSGARERLDLQLSLRGKKHHPGLVEVLDGGELGEYSTIYLVMEYVLGTSLDKLCGRIPYGAIEVLVSQLASACEYLESRELVHRDIKPANIVVSDDFQSLTLLDLGIIHHLPADDGGRLSGDEFVATTRYSPPEFVWRTEEAEPDSWRAVTFYQIGATLHDMIMGAPLFVGYDKPKARLYDAVRDRTPEVKSDHVSPWLVELAQTCLLKDWRQRIKLLRWSSFAAPPQSHDVEYQQHKIRLRQLRQEEKKKLGELEATKPPAATRAQALWDLNTALIHELRTYVFSADILPRCSINEVAVSDEEYLCVFSFDRDEARGFSEGVVVSVRLSVDKDVAEASNLHVEASIAGDAIKSWSWTEMFVVEAAVARCQQAFIEAADAVMTREGL